MNIEPHFYDDCPMAWEEYGAIMAGDNIQHYATVQFGINEVLHAVSDTCQGGDTEFFKAAQQGIGHLCAAQVHVHAYMSVLAEDVDTLSKDMAYNANKIKTQLCALFDLQAVRDADAFNDLASRILYSIKPRGQ